MSDAEKAVADKVFGDNSPEELTADAVQAADAINRGVMPEPKAAPEPKPGGAVAAEPGSDPDKPETAKPGEKTPEELAAEAEAAKAAEAEAEAAKAGKTPEELAAEEEAAKAAGKTPEELAAEAEAAKVAAAKKEDDDEPEPTRMRVRRESFNSDLEWKTAQLMAREKLPADKAIAMAKEILGIKADAPAPVETPAPEVEAFQTITKTLDEKEAERDAALLAYDNEKVVALNKEIRTLTQQATKAERDIEKAQVARTSIQASIDRAIKEFPESSVPGHPMYTGVKAFWDSLEASDPLWHDPNRAEVAAQRVAEGLEKLGLKVTRTSKSASAATAPLVTPAKAPAVPKPQKVSPVPGSARTTTPTLTPDAALDAELKKAMGKNAHVLSTIS